MEAVVVLTTVGNLEDGKTIARRLVEEKLSACVSILPIERSIYFWEGKIVEEGEVLLLIKTLKEKIPLLKERLVALHPYTVAEFLVLPVIEGGEKYLRWLEGYLTL